MMLKRIATLYRTAQLYAHAAHNTVSGPNFFADHGFLGELYPVYEAAYDALVERAIGLSQEIDPLAIGREAGVMSSNMDDQQPFDVIAGIEKDLVRVIEAEIQSGKQSQGTINLLAQLADDSEARQYKIGQRLK